MARKGWHRESKRHSLAARGVETGKSHKFSAKMHAARITSAAAISRTQKITQQILLLNDLRRQIFDDASKGAPFEKQHKLREVEDRQDDDIREFALNEDRENDFDEEDELKEEDESEEE